MRERSSSVETMKIDGSYGEGGGQTLRTAATFSIIMGMPIRVIKIRAGRKEPGLRPQHLAVLEVLRDISGGSLEGGSVGSTSIAFAPGPIKSQSVTLDLGTAASITLLLQAVVPAVALSGSSLELELTGGTDVPWSPTSDYLEKVVAPAFGLAGVEFDYRVARRGYYPRGGGRAHVSVRPSRGVKSVDLSVGGEAGLGISVVSRCGMLPRSVAERQAASATSRLRENGLVVGSLLVETGESSSPGSSILVSSVGERTFIGSDALGARGKPAETVGREAADDFLRVRATFASLDVHIADMLAPLLCLCNSPSRLLVPEVTEHMRTSLHVASLFTGAAYSASGGGGSTLVTVNPATK